MLDQRQLKTNYEFLETIRSLCVAYEQISVMKKNKIKDPEKLLLMGKNEKTVDVLLSANNKLYGDILNKVFYKFIEETRNKNTDLVIIGRLGKEMYDDLGLKKTYIYFEIPDTDLTVSDLKPVINNIIKYSKINVFF